MHGELPVEIGPAPTGRNEAEQAEQDVAEAEIEEGGTIHRAQKGGLAEEPGGGEHQQGHRNAIGVEEPE